jgi:phage terminase large subunit-like protein
VSDLFASGMVWVPNKHWAEEVMEEVASFPAGEHDDYVDSTSMALMRFRKGGFIRLPSDKEDDIQYFKQRRGGFY